MEEVYFKQNEMLGVRSGKVFVWTLINGHKMYPVKVQLVLKVIGGKKKVELGKSTKIPSGSTLEFSGNDNTGTANLHFDNKPYQLFSFIGNIEDGINLIFTYSPKGFNGSDGPIVFDEAQYLESAKA